MNGEITLEQRVDEFLKRDTSNLSLEEMIADVGRDVLGAPHQLFRLRIRHERDSGVPMEEDEFGEVTNDLAEFAMPEVSRMLHDD